MKTFVVQFELKIGNETETVNINTSSARRKNDLIKGLKAIPQVTGVQELVVKEPIKK